MSASQVLELKVCTSTTQRNNLKKPKLKTTKKSTGFYSKSSKYAYHNRCSVIFLLVPGQLCRAVTVNLLIQMQRIWNNRVNPSREKYEFHYVIVVLMRMAGITGGL